MKEKSFYIDKWYLDLVTDDNEAWIFYSAKLEWHGLAAPYTSILSSGKSGKVERRSRFHHVSFPSIHEENIHWKDPRFKVEGNWKSISKPLYARLYDSPAGYLDWFCHMPGADVVVNIDGKTYTGKGYVEQIVLTVPPWKIPIDELRWGRYISDDDNMVWVDFKNGKWQQWVWINGEKMEYVSINDDQIRVFDKSLDMKVIHTIENEKSISNVVENLVHFLPGFKKILPLKFLMAHNYKWVSKGILSTNGSPNSHGNVVHELVEFKEPA